MKRKPTKYISLIHKDGSSILCKAAILKEKGGLAIHKHSRDITRPKEDNKFHFTITHISSGRRLPHMGFVYRAAAVRALDKLQKIGVDWTATVEEMKQNTNAKTVTKKLLKISIEATTRRKRNNE